MLASLLSLVSAGTSTNHRTSLSIAIEGYCRTYRGTNFLNDVLTRAGNFCLGASTGGEVPTPLVAIADQMVMLKCYQKPELLRKNAPPVHDISKFASIEFWRALFMRLLRDRMDRVFTAYCSPGDPDADSKRHQKDIDSQSFVELLAQGFNAELENVPGLLTACSDVASVEGFCHAVGSLCLQATRRSACSTKTTCGNDKILTAVDVASESGVDTSGVELDMDMMSLMSMDIDDLELDEFEQEAPLENLPASAPSVAATLPTIASTAADENESSAVHVPVLMGDFIDWCLQTQRSLPARGSPSTLLSCEEAVRRGTDSLRRLIVLRVLKGLEKELQFVMNASVHMMHQVSDGAISGDDVSASSIFELLGIEMNEQGVLWLVSQIIVATKLRANSVFRSAMELTTHTPEAVFNSVNTTVSKKQEGAWLDAEERRLAALRQRIRSKYLSHPDNLAPLPLRIRDDEHLAQINVWCTKHRGFALLRSVTPNDSAYTGMAKNTYLNPTSPYFMEPVNPFMVIVDTYGAAEEREQSEFCEHFHTFSKGVFDEVHTSSSGIREEDKFRVFHERLMAHYGPVKYELVMGLSMWISVTLDNHFNDDYASAKNMLLRQVGGVAPEDMLNTVLRTELDWHTNPAEFLERHFAPTEVDRRRCVLTIERFVKSLGNELSEETKAVAEEVYRDIREQDKERAAKWAALASGTT